MTFDNNLSEELVDLSPKLQVVFCQVKKHRVHLRLLELHHLVETCYPMERANPHLIYLVIQHVNQKPKAVLSDLGALLCEEAHRPDACESHSHRIIFKQKK